MTNPTADRDASILWSRALLQDGRFLVLDTETTDLEGQIIEIGVIDAQGKTRMHQMVRPDRPISAQAQKAHGIRMELLQGQPRFWEIAEDARALLAGRTVVVYNAEFDKGRFYYEVELMERSVLGEAAGVAAHAWVSVINWECAMNAYSAFVGIETPDGYKRQRLGGNHRALGDCRACLEKIKKMAAAPLSTEK